MSRAEDDKPKITYPCLWTFAVIGTSEDELRTAIRQVVGSRKHTAHFSKKSEHGKYCSLHMEMTVMSETDRNYIFEGLKSKPQIKMVL